MWKNWTHRVRPLDPYYAAGIAVFWVALALAAFMLIRH
jgi:hypothetical protein